MRRIARRLPPLTNFCSQILLWRGSAENSLQKVFLFFNIDAIIKSKNGKSTEMKGSAYEKSRIHAIENTV